MDFKFFQKPKLTQPPGNFYLMFNMDDALINVIRWKQYHNIEIIGSASADTQLAMVNVPINGWLRIIHWRRHNVPICSVEIDYRVIEVNAPSRNFTFKMNENEFLRRIDITGI
jgi:hypothetical protein